MRTSAYALQTSGRLISLPLDGSFTVGRRAPDLSVASDRTMSRTQCRFLHHQGLLFVEDLGATNPTLLNGRALTARSPAPVKVGDAVLAGSTLIEIASHIEKPRPVSRSSQPKSLTRPLQNPLIYTPKRSTFFGRLTLAGLRLLLVVVIAATAYIQFEARLTAEPKTAVANDQQLAQSFFEGALTSSDEFQALASQERQELLSCISATMLKPHSGFEPMIDAFNQNHEASQEKLKAAFANCSDHHLDSEAK